MTFGLALTAGASVILMHTVSMGPAVVGILDIRRVCDVWLLATGGCPAVVVAAFEELFHHGIFFFELFRELRDSIC